FVRRAQERRRQRTARAAVGAGLAMAAGLTVAALLTARTSSGPAGQTVNTPPLTVAPGSGAGAVGTAGLAPSIEPPPTLPIETPPAGNSSPSVGSTAP
ncbi:MAG TPA: hypothetical protein VGI06_03295, partial [Acidimicrobiales bacterium]